MHATIFVTDDEPTIRSALIKRLSQRHHRVTGFESGEALINALDREVPDLVLLDLKMPGLSGLEALKVLRSKCPQLLIVMLTAYGTVQDAVEAIKLGAYNFVVKTIDLKGLDRVVEHAVELLTLRHRTLDQTEHEGDHFTVDRFVSNSAAMQTLLAQVLDIAQNPGSTLLLVGETGTGKEFLARFLHYNGPRADGPFVRGNCTAIPRDLIESELFGYEPGAFRGASHPKVGLLERCNGGTLFLEEIRDLDLSVQDKLLRVLEEGRFRRLKGTMDIAVDFRLVAATVGDLKRAVTEGSFRKDLYFRLHAGTFELPPLRERVEDIILLAMQALAVYGRKYGKAITDIDPKARLILERYDYPGNIRELHNIIERAVVFCHRRTLTPDCLGRELHEAVSREPAVLTHRNQAFGRIRT